jgi:hypothetical protein
MSAAREAKARSARRRAIEQAPTNNHPHFGIGGGGAE